MTDKKIDLIDLAPNWYYATQIHCMVLENPNASDEAKESSRNEILRLAMAYDETQGR